VNLLDIADVKQKWCEDSTSLLLDDSNPIACLRPSSGLRNLSPDQLEKIDIVLDKLGGKGLQRLTQFQNYSIDSYEERQEAILSPCSLEGFYRFLKTMNFPKESSLFLTDAGFLELCWEDSSGQAIQVEFTSKGVESYVENTGQEDFVPYSNIEEIAKKLFPLS